MSNTNSSGQSIPSRNQDEISTTSEGSKIVYERSFLINMRNCPLARTPPRNLPNIPIGLWNNNQAVTGAWGRGRWERPGSWGIYAYCVSGRVKGHFITTEIIHSSWSVTVIFILKFYPWLALWSYIIYFEFYFNILTVLKKKINIIILLFYLLSIGTKMT